MNKLVSFSVATICGLCLFFFACSGGDSQKDPGLYYSGPNPILMKVQDTLKVKFKKVSLASLTGKTTEDPNYQDVKFEIREADSLYIKSVRSSVLIALKATTDTLKIHAIDDVDESNHLELKVLISE